MPNTKDFEFHIDLGNGATVTNAAVTIYGITSADPVALDSREVSGPDFSVSLAVDDAETFYAVAEIKSCRLEDGTVIETGDRTVQWVSVFTEEACAEEAGSVALSERLTVATAYSFARFLDVDDGGRVVLSGPSRALRIAYGMKNNFVATSGALSEVIQSPPNGMQTNSYALFNFLSNLAYYSLTVDDVYAELTQLTGADSLFEALLQMAHDPFIEVGRIYQLIGKREQVYAPSLPSLQPPATPIPDQWTLTIKVNDSGAENFMIGGVGYVAFDCNDRVWLTNNVRQGTPNSSTFCVVLEPDGSPAPFSPVFGGGLLGAGFGVTADPAGKNIYFGNYGWGPTEWNPQSGSISVISHQGEVLSPPNGIVNGLSRVQGLEFDAEDNLWMCSWGSQEPMPPTDSKYNLESPPSAVVVYLEGDPDRALIHRFDSPYHLTFDVTFDDDGYAYVSNGGSGEHGVRSSVCKFRIEDGELFLKECWQSEYQDPGQPSKVGYEALRQITVSPEGEILVVGVASNRVIRLDRDLNFLGDYSKNIHGPWGVTVDAGGTIYVANFQREMGLEGDVQDDFGPYGVTVIQDGEDSTALLMTLPTGGDEVTLANGLPLYGNPETSGGDQKPLHSYDPVMRLTATRIDRAGNLWACNNWKPSGDIDIQQGNPGGDGMVIFVGVAEPDPDS